MKNILRIAKTELRILFYSPIAWFLLIAFLVQVAMIYMQTFRFFFLEQESGGWGAMGINDMTNRILSDENGILARIMRKLYLFIPLITMSLLSRETETGTIKLLYSSPVRVWHIVAGKFMSMLLFCLLMTVIVLIFMIATVFNIQNADIGILFPAALALFLVLCTYSAIGLFMSCLTRYQVVAAIATFLMIGALTYIRDVWQQYDFIRDLTYFLSIQGRAEHLLNGLIVSRDVMYFFVVIYIFLGLAYFRLRGGLESKPILVRTGFYFAVIASGLAIGYISSLSPVVAYLDTTNSQRNTIKPEVQKMLLSMDAPIEVTTYINALDGFIYMSAPKGRNQLLAHWDHYRRFKPDMKFNFMYYYDEPIELANRGFSLSTMYAGKTLKQAAQQVVEGSGMKLSAFIPPAEVKKMIDLRPEHNRFVMQLRYKGSTTFLRIFDDAVLWPLESEVAAAVKRLLVKNKPKILFLTGNGERNIYEKSKKAYQALFNNRTSRFSLINQGFDLDTISLENRQIPKEVTTIVIADPKIALPPTTLAKIQHYVQEGGNLLITAEPGRQAILNPLLGKIGVQLEEGIIVQPEKNHTPDVLRPSIGLLTNSFVTQMGNLGNLFRQGGRLEMPGAAAITFKDGSGFHLSPLLLSDEHKAWLKKGKLVTDSAAVVFNPDAGDIKGAFFTAVALSRRIKGKEQRIIVSGDADFMSNECIADQQIGNMPLSTGMINWLDYGEFPINVRKADPIDNHINLSYQTLIMHKLVFMWLLPGLLIVSGIIILIRRKRK